MTEVTPTFTVKEAQTIIELLEAEAKRGVGKVEFYRNIIAKIQETEGYLAFSGVFEEKPKPGYHLTEIPRGTFGEISKILEEAAELKDAMEQGQKLMCLIEISDLYGAMEGYLKKTYGDKVTMTDIHNMAYATMRAFESGRRK
jgi:hypothetical protein